MNEPICPADVFVIGGGPGGYKTAQLLAARGVRTVLAEKNALGGVCLNEGCIPFKSYLHTAHILRRSESLRGKGLLCGAPSALNLPQLQRETRQVVERLRESVRIRLEESGAVVLSGTAHVVRQTQAGIFVAVGADTYCCRHLVLATGSRDVPMPDVPEDAAYTVWNSRTLPEQTELPQQADIVGAGAAGLEAASFLNAAGCRVTILEASDSIGGAMDAQISRALAHVLRRQGIEMLTGTRFLRAERDAVVCERRGETIRRTPQALLTAFGRRPQFDRKALALLGVAATEKGIVIDAQCRTTNPHVFAVGDVTGTAMLAHTAYRQAQTAAEAICGGTARMEYSAVPRVVYTSPQVLSIGLREEECRAAGMTYTARTLPMAYSGAYYAENGADGAKAKMIVDADGRIVGFHMIGDGAGELSLAAELMLRHRMTPREIGSLVFAHPTYSEIIGELAALFPESGIEKQLTEPADFDTL